MNRIVSSGLICVKNRLNVEFSLCKIEYTLYENGAFKYVFTPYYDVIKLLDDDIFQGIPGIELELKKKEYIRENIVPTFISERVPSENRENFHELIEEVGLTYMDPIEYLIRSKLKYSGDCLYIKPFIERKIINLNTLVSKSNSLGTTKIILDNLAAGNKIVIGDDLIENNRITFITLEYIYEKSYQDVKVKQQKGIYKAKNEGKYCGRKPIKVDELLFLEQIDLLNNNDTNLDDALKKLNISKSTFYRLKKKYHQ